MKLFYSHLAGALAVISVFSCGGKVPANQRPSSQETRQTITALLDSVANWISDLDADAIAARMPSDSAIVYVSDGQPIRGTELRTVLHNFYSGVRSLEFRWDSTALASLGDQTWGATSWARISVTDSIGRVTKSRAIFTWTIVRAHDRWILALAHKAAL
jgi:hypothetical protein